MSLRRGLLSEVKVPLEPQYQQDILSTANLKHTEVSA
jgi:hypothetical protein